MKIKGFKKPAVEIREGQIEILYQLKGKTWKFLLITGVINHNEVDLG